MRGWGRWGGEKGKGTEFILFIVHRKKGDESERRGARGKEKRKINK